MAFLNKDALDQHKNSYSEELTDWYRERVGWYEACLDKDKLTWDMMPPNWDVLEWGRSFPIMDELDD